MPKQCECADVLCPVHPGATECQRQAVEKLYRIDMQDQSGVLFCQGCGDDAANAGIFATAEPFQQ